VWGIPYANRRDGKEAWSFASAKVLQPNASEGRRWSDRACLQGMSYTGAYHDE
jgi:hypothetical protein